MAKKGSSLGRSQANHEEEWLMQSISNEEAVDFLQEMNQFMESAMELTHMIVNAQLAQNKTLDPQQIFAIFDQSVETIVKNISVIARNS